MDEDIPLDTFDDKNDEGDKDDYETLDTFPYNEPGPSSERDKLVPKGRRKGKGSKTAETIFVEGNVPSDRVFSSARKLKIRNAIEKLKKEFPRMNENYLILDVDDVVAAIAKKKGKTTYHKV